MPACVEEAAPVVWLPAAHYFNVLQVVVRPCHSLPKHARLRRQRTITSTCSSSFWKMERCSTCRISTLSNTLRMRLFHRSVFLFFRRRSGIRRGLCPTLPAQVFHSLCRILKLPTLLPGELEACTGDDAHLITDRAVRCPLHLMVSVGGVGMSCFGLCSYFSVGPTCVSHASVFISSFLAFCSCLCWCSFLSSVVRSSPRRNVAASGSAFSFSILTVCYCSR